MNLRRGVIGLAVLALPSGCIREQDCSAVGYTSGVGIELSNPQASLTEFCVDDQCLPAAALGQDSGFVSVSDQPAEYTYRVRVVQPDGTELVREGTVTTRPYRGNGAGCDPLTANAGVTVDVDGNVTFEYP